MNNPFDFKRITEEMDMDPEDILHLMTIYQIEVQKDLSDLENHLSSENWPLTMNKLHKMKGDASNLCLASLAEAFAEMEVSALSKDSDCIFRQLESFQSMKFDFLSAYEQYTSQRK